MSEAIIDQFNEHMGIDGAVRFAVGPGGITRVELTAKGAQAHVLLHGAQVVHYQPADGEPVIFTSDQAIFARGHAIRGGVPICFPWFGQRREGGQGLLHGFARNRAWKVTRTLKEPDGRVRVLMSLSDDERTREFWPHAFELIAMVTLGSSLKISLAIRNPGDRVFSCEAALHTYFAVSDVRQVRLVGLESSPYLDKLDHFARKEAEGKPLTLTGPVDRIYPDAPARLLLHDPGPSRRIQIDQIGAESTIVWNPWSDGAQRFADLADDAWPKMLCVETGSVGHNAFQVKPGAFHEIQAIYTVSS
ncbi:MAG: D-hexose-6-phosphate mutarotase [Phycisphaeraceae bacterium]|nr:D-hexose-6-phosphate mutarotase [Phycisphaeraceae bacterium]